jgi:hypothetical protein
MRVITYCVLIIQGMLRWLYGNCIGIELRANFWSETLGINLQNSKLHISATYVEMQGKLIY